MVWKATAIPADARMTIGTAAETATETGIVTATAVIGRDSCRLPGMTGAVTADRNRGDRIFPIMGVEKPVGARQRNSKKGMLWTKAAASSFLRRHRISGPGNL